MHPFKRKIAIVLLGAGTVLGFGHAFATMRGRACARRDAFERHVAALCVDAARRDGASDASEPEEPRGRPARHGWRHEAARQAPRDESDSLR